MTTDDYQVAQEHEGTPEQMGPPRAFIEQVKGALDHLYDLDHLQRYPVVRGGKSPAEPSVEIGGQRLRQELAAAVETLNPGAGVPFRAPHARLYNLVRLHYVQGMTVQEAARELGISIRQAYRDLRRGEKSVAAALWARCSAPSLQEVSAAQLSSVREEMARLETHPQPTDMRLLLGHAQEAVKRLAQQRDVCFHVDAPPEAVTVSVDPVVARQVLVGLLSHAVRQAQPGTLHLALTAVKERVTLLLRYDPGLEAAEAPAVDLVVAQLADRLGWAMSREDQPSGTRTVTLHIATRGSTVLVIDDNEGLVKLLDRYLTDHAYRVIAATGGQEGLHLAQELLPDAIVLDVMMPGMDGWELLQRLRAWPQTANIPVVICSVINDPDLAQSLGASSFLPKPVSRDDVLDALHRIGVV
jgi:CheY-like chemotaxis protein/transposase